MLTAIKSWPPTVHRTANGNVIGLRRRLPVVDVPQTTHSHTVLLILCFKRLESIVLTIFKFLKMLNRENVSRFKAGSHGGNLFIQIDFNDFFKF